MSSHKEDSTLMGEGGGEGRKLCVGGFKHCQVVIVTKLRTVQQYFVHDCLNRSEIYKHLNCKVITTQIHI